MPGRGNRGVDLVGAQYGAGPLVAVVGDQLDRLVLDHDVDLEPLGVQAGGVVVVGAVQGDAGQRDARGEGEGEPLVYHNRQYWKLTNPSP